ncbi:hypothetical protein ACFTSD_02665 [Nocardiaceae bacterium NPDC056970]
MERHAKKRPQVAIRLTEAQIDDLDWLAGKEGLHMKNGDPNRSELVRIMLAYAREYMPNGWRPEHDA